jgi:hypothetical protein
VFLLSMGPMAFPAALGWLESAWPVAGALPASWLVMAALASVVQVVDGSGGLASEASCVLDMHMQALLT